MDTYLDENGKFDVKLWAVWAEKRGFMPWQMTIAEYSNFLDGQRKPLAEQQSHLTLQAIAIVEIDRLAIKRSQLEHHQRSVKHALQAGKCIRPEVLADYGLDVLCKVS